MAGELRDFFAGRGIHEVDAIVRGAHGQDLAVGAECEGGRVVLVDVRELDDVRPDPVAGATS